MKRTRPYLIVFCVLLLGAAGLYATPHVTLWRLRAAVARGDSAAISSHVDYPRLRESLKAALSAAMLKRADEHASVGVSAIGTLLAGALVDRMMDVLVTPESIALLMQGQLPTDGQLVVTPPSELKTELGYEDFSTFVVTLQRPEQTDPVGVVFTRDGLSWKLSAVRLPL